MKTKLTRQLLMAMLSALVIAATAQAADMMKKETNGMFAGSGGHMAAGKAEVTKGMDGKPMLTLTDIKVEKVPDGHVYLAKDGDYMKGVDVGVLKQFSGTVSFALPMGVNADDYDSVVIWCKKFKVEIGRAYLPKKMM